MMKPEESLRDPEQELSDAECAEFQASMPERIGAGEDLQTDPHMLTCERCRSLVRELEYIAEAARLLMPIVAVSAAGHDRDIGKCAIVIVLE